MPRFHSDYSDLKLTAPSRGIEIRFVDGSYETEDEQEIHLLERESSVTEAVREPFTLATGLHQNLDVTRDAWIYDE